MNENSLPPMPAIKDWLTNATQLLTNAGIPSAKLDSEIILEGALQKDRSHLYAYPDEIISINTLKIAEKNLAKRIKRVPIAYIIGCKEFYGRNFTVNSSTLIPRPESEQIIETLKDILKNTTQEKLTLIDVGTGSGCLGITAKLEYPDLSVILSDVSNSALDVANSNAQKLKATITSVQSNLLDTCPGKIDIILANLPYVDKSWERSPETDYEPSLALFAKNNGKRLIIDLIDQAAGKLNPNGYLIIESDPVQHDSLINYAINQNFKLVSKKDYIFCLTNNAGANTTKTDH